MGQGLRGKGKARQRTALLDQTERKTGEQRQHYQRHATDDEKGQGDDEHLSGLGTGNGRCHEEAQSHGRRHQAQHEVDDGHHAKMPGVDAVDIGGNGQQDRHRHDQAGNAVNHRADDQQDDVGQQQKGDGVVGHGLDPGGYGLRHLAVDQQP